MNEHHIVIPPEGCHRYSVRVYTDAGGVVYHASYLRFAERARTEALRDLGIAHAELLERFSLMFMVRRIEVDYLRPARVDDLLSIATEVLAVGGASVGLQQTIRGPHGDCAGLTLRLACVRAVAAHAGGGGTPDRGPGQSKPGRLPPRWRGVLQAMRDARAAGESQATGSMTSGAA
jgi:acyl-CoA thioester hydrolase